jgi:hypothetical protein
VNEYLTRVLQYCGRGAGFVCGRYSADEPITPNLPMYKATPAHLPLYIVVSHRHRPEEILDD